jgi:hypothetical protein
MAENTLVTEKIQAGKALIAAADTANVPLRAALWLYDSNEDSWALVLEAEPSAGLGLREFSRRLHKAVAMISDESDRRAAADLLVGDVALFTRPHPVAQMLRPSMGTAPSVALARLRNTAIGSQIVDGALLYRLERSQAV